MILRIVPRDPLVVRDGRPFSAFPGAKIRGYPFPPPQVVAGAIRGWVGLLRGWTKADADKWRTLQTSLCLKGPLLASAEGSDLFFPAPLDALLMRETSSKLQTPSCPNDGALKEAQYMLYRLAPKPLPKEALTNLPEGLLPVFPLAEMNKDKPAPMPSFWHKEVFYRWLLGEPGKKPEISSPVGLGLPRLPEVYRTHVKIASRTQTAEEHMLFETQGLEFIYNKGNQGQLFTPHDLALLVRLSGDAPPLKGVAPLGGERRLALWQTVETDLWPSDPPERLIGEILKTKAARVILLTPADFNAADDEKNPHPFLPLHGRIHGAPVQAAAVGRPLTVSGWDMLESKPKPSRRLVPPGSVYFVDLSGLSEDQVKKWVEGIWMENLHEQPKQSRCDGYGLAAVGVWRKSDATEA